MKEPAGCLSQQATEAGGSLTLGLQGRTASSSDNDGIDSNYQAIEVRQARRNGVT